MTLIRKISQTFVLSVSILFVHTTQADEVIVQTANGGVNWSQGSIFAHGYGVAPQNQIGSSKARLLARRAAQLDAYRNLAEIVNGVRVNSQTLVQDMTLASDTVRTQVEAVIKGAIMTKDHYQNDVASVTMEIPMAGNLMETFIPKSKTQQSGLTSTANGLSGFELYQAQFNSSWVAFKQSLDLNFITKAYAAPQPFVITTAEEAEFTKRMAIWLQVQGAEKVAMQLDAFIKDFENTANFTGLLIDASSVTDFKIAAVPTIRSESGDIIYPNDDTSYDDLVKKRPVSYDFDVDDAIRNTRVAIKPMIVKAKNTYKLRKSDLVIGDAEAKILQNNKTIYQVMHNAGVMVVVAD
ncbi:LPP20 family lipoprotein [Catenovulum agarivorans]|uniref:LPP20 family lipoprotein n=1 Tax=Catenovulum agarivorans TaxID=1172192 RepID=UPI0002D59E17|nr:LPP20 family lipoprotein [Catenovulum agarivorans]